MHMLEPDSDTEEKSTTKVVVVQDTSKSAQKKGNKVKIEIDDEDDVEDSSTDIRNSKKTAEVLEHKNQQAACTTTTSTTTIKAATTAPSAPPTELSGPSKDHFHFECLSDRKPFPFLGGDKELTDLISKWGLGESMSCLQFSYEMVTSADPPRQEDSSKSAKTTPGHVHPALLPEFSVELLNSEEFLRFFRCGDGHGNVNSEAGGGHKNATPLHYPSPVTSVKLEMLRTRETTLAMFDRLVAPARGDPDAQNKAHPRMRDLPHEIVRDNGRVCNMPDVFLPCGITVSDQLRGVFMLNEDETECYDAFSEDERSEFLWHVMRRLVAGGAVNQYEDEFEPYKDATRDVYKSLVSVGRKKNQQQQSDSTSANDNSSPFEVQSIVALVKDIRCGKSSVVKLFFPKDDRTGNHNFLYIIVDPIRRTCIVWYNAFFSPF